MSGPLAGRELAERITPETGRILRVIALAMGVGIAVLAGVVVFFHLRSAGRAPAPESVRLVNVLTAASMALALAAIVASELLWKSLLRGAGADNVSAKIQSAFIVRSALREGAALLGCVTALLAAMGGVLRAYPAYWADLVPAVLFWSYLSVHWPSDENLKDEAARALPPVPGT